MPDSENVVTESLPSEPSSTTASAERPIAPFWHTIVLIAAIGLLSFEGARQLSGTAGGAAHESRLTTYASTVFSEVLMLAWVYFGLRLRKVPFRSLFGNLTGGARSLFLDLGIAGLFWIASIVILGTINVTWYVIDAAVHHRSFFGPHGKTVSPNPGQQHLLHTLGSLAPSNGREVLAWAVVCAMAGLIEELVFRGYFQRQFTAWGRGAIGWGVVFSAFMFGGAHGYQGIHNMVLLSTFGVLFSLVVVFRGNLRPAIFAHAWNDFIMGLLLMVARSRHLI